MSLEQFKHRLSGRDWAPVSLMTFFLKPNCMILPQNFRNKKLAMFKNSCKVNWKSVKQIFANKENANLKYHWSPALSIICLNAECCNSVRLRHVLICDKFSYFQTDILHLYISVYCQRSNSACMIGLFQKRSGPPPPPDGWDSGNSHGRGGQRPWKSRQEGGVKLEKVFCLGHFDRLFTRFERFVQWHPSNLRPENSRNILFSYFPPIMNDNLSSFTGPFIAENTNNKILKNMPSQCCSNEVFETPDTFLLVPRPSTPPLCNFM